MRRFQEGRPITARPVGPLERGWHWCRRNPVVAALTAAVAGLLVAVALGSALAAVYYVGVADRESRLKDDARVAQEKAEANAAESRQRLVQQYVDKSMRLAEEGDYFSACPGWPRPCGWIREIRPRRSGTASGSRRCCGSVPGWSRPGRTRGGSPPRP